MTQPVPWKDSVAEPGIQYVFPALVQDHKIVSEEEKTFKDSRHISLSFENFFGFQSIEKNSKESRLLYAEELFCIWIY